MLLDINEGYKEFQQDSPNGYLVIVVLFFIGCGILGIAFYWAKNNLFG